MAQAHSAAQTAAWAAQAHTMHVHVYAQWDRSNWTDETSRVRAIAIDMSLYDRRLGLPGLGQGSPGEATITLDNGDNRYLPDNAGSPLHAHIGGGIYRVPVRIEMAYAVTPAEDACRQFTGQIESAGEQEEVGVKTATLHCTDTCADALQHKHSTVALAGLRADELIALLLTEAGLSGGTFDRGMTVIPYAWLDDENIWAECQAIAAADGGVLYVDEPGAPRFERMTHWLEGSDHTAAQATLDRGNGWWFSPANSWRDCYSAVIVERAPRYLGGVLDLYRATDVIEVPPTESKTEKCRFRYPAYTVVPPESGKDYVAVSAGMDDLSSNLTVGVTAYAQHADVELANANASHALYLMNFKLRGVPLLGDEAQETRQESSLGLLPDSKEYPLRGNPFIQDALQAERLAGFLRDRLERPRRLLAWRGVACPWLQLGDRVHVDDSSATGFHADGYLLSKAHRYQAGGPWEMELAILPAADLFAEETYFLLGTSAWGEPSDPLFY